MHAVIQKDYNGIDSIQTVNISTPKSSIIGALVDVKYVPVLPWDIKNEKGLLTQMHTSSLPKILGYGFSGTIHDNNIFGPTRGTRVVGASPNGTYAEIINASIPPYVFLLPDNVSLEASATIFGGADTAMMMIQSVGVHPNDIVLLIGASGSIGSYLYQMLLTLKANVTILSSKRSFKYTKSIFPSAQVVSDIDLISNNSVNFVLDTAGSETLLNQAENKLFEGGTLFTSALPTYQKQRIDIYSEFNNNPISPNRYKEIIEMLSNGTLKAHINKIFKFNDVKAAQHYEDETASRGRILVNINE